MAAVELFSSSFFSDANLVSYYRLEGNSNDSKGSSNGSDTSITYNSSFGKFGQGANLNGTTSYINFGNAAALQLSTVSINVWFKTSKDYTGFYANIFGKWQAWDIDINPSNHLIAYNYSTNTEIDSGVVVNDNIYHMATLTLPSNGGVAKLYVDGIQKVTGVITIFNQTRSLTLGSYDGSGQYYKDSADDPSVFSRVLTPTEVSTLYDTTVLGYVDVQYQGGVNSGVVVTQI